MTDEIEKTCKKCSETFYTDNEEYNVCLPCWEIIEEERRNTIYIYHSGLPSHALRPSLSDND